MNDSFYIYYKQSLTFKTPVGHVLHKFSSICKVSSKCYKIMDGERVQYDSVMKKTSVQINLGNKIDPTNNIKMILQYATGNDNSMPGSDVLLHMS